MISPRPPTNVLLAVTAKISLNAVIKQLFKIRRYQIFPSSLQHIQRRGNRGQSQTRQNINLGAKLKANSSPYNKTNSWSASFWSRGKVVAFVGRYFDSDCETYPMWRLPEMFTLHKTIFLEIRRLSLVLSCSGLVLKAFLPLHIYLRIWR